MARPGPGHRPARPELLRHRDRARPRGRYRRPDPAVELRPDGRARQPDQDAQTANVWPRQPRPTPQASPDVPMTASGITESEPEPSRALHLDPGPAFGVPGTAREPGEKGHITPLTGPAPSGMTCVGTAGFEPATP